MLPAPFDTLGPDDWTRRTLDKGQFVFRQGDRPNAMFFLETGTLQLVRHTMGGDTVLVHHAIAGQTFAEASLFSNEYHCDAVVQDSAIIAVLDKAAILKTMARDAAFSYALTAHLAAQVQAYRQRIELLAIRSASERVYASVTAGLLKGNIKSLSSEIGLTHEATYRALADLVAAGRLTKTGRGSYSLP
ncbi:MAG: Crp/Fnr family transcriptional regulator [Alphaproteobacteria bacterium]|nr:Crp/Fnr family transcriptional regulator [Alphaproteobacteria bacterium]